MITLKKLDESYVDEVMKIYRSVFTNAPWFDDWSDTAQLHAYICDMMCNRNSLTFGFIADGELIAVSLGYVLHWCEGTQYYIREFFVSAPHQHNGVGTRFLNCIEHELRLQDVKSVFLGTNPHLPAYKFYDKNGFSPISDYVSMIIYL